MSITKRLSDLIPLQFALLSFSVWTDGTGGHKITPNSAKQETSRVITETNGLIRICFGQFWLNWCPDYMDGWMDNNFSAQKKSEYNQRWLRSYVPWSFSALGQLVVIWSHVHGDMRWRCRSGAAADSWDAEKCGRPRYKRQLCLIKSQSECVGGWDDHMGLICCSVFLHFTQFWPENVS